MAIYQKLWLISLALEDLGLLGLTSWKEEQRNDMRKAVRKGSTSLDLLR